MIRTLRGLSSPLAFAELGCFGWADTSRASRGAHSGVRGNYRHHRISLEPPSDGVARRNLLFIAPRLRTLNSSIGGEDARNPY